MTTLGLIYSCLNASTVTSPMMESKSEKSNNAYYIKNAKLSLWNLDDYPKFINSIDLSSINSHYSKITYHQVSEIIKITDDKIGLVIQNSGIIVYSINHNEGTDDIVYDYQFNYENFDYHTSVIFNGYLYIPVSSSKSIECKIFDMMNKGNHADTVYITDPDINDIINSIGTNSIEIYTDVYLSKYGIIFDIYIKERSAVHKSYSFIHQFFNGKINNISHVLVDRDDKPALKCITDVSEFTHSIEILNDDILCVRYNCVINFYQLGSTEPRIMATLDISNYFKYCRPLMFRYKFLVNNVLRDVILVENLHDSGKIILYADVAGLSLSIKFNTSSDISLKNKSIDTIKTLLNQLSECGCSVMQLHNSAFFKEFSEHFITDSTKKLILPRHTSYRHCPRFNDITLYRSHYNSDSILQLKKIFEDNSKLPRIIYCIAIEYLTHWGDMKTLKPFPYINII